MPVLSWLLVAGRRSVRPSMWPRGSTPRGRNTRDRSDGGSQLSPSAGGSDSGPGFLGNEPARRRERRKRQKPPESATGKPCAAPPDAPRPEGRGRLTTMSARLRPHHKENDLTPRRPRTSRFMTTRLDSPSPGTAPRPLQARARPAQPSEPILLPKVRIQVADFPYPHSSSH